MLFYRQPLKQNGVEFAEFDLKIGILILHIPTNSECSILGRLSTISSNINVGEASNHAITMAGHRE
ncbi:MAG TPA: hypothetical protein VLE21_02730 [Candidatus Nitrosocosmicus sp.]|nr:hypothetical protein [Candidatus Nitrosocosmicus sp.]